MTLAAAVVLAHMLDGAVIVAEAGVLTISLALPLLVQPPTVTATAIPIGVVEPAVTVIVLVPCPLAIVPLPAGRDHAYVAPVVGGTLAVKLPFAQTAGDESVMAAGGGLQADAVSVMSVGFRA